MSSKATKLGRFKTKEQAQAVQTLLNGTYGVGVSLSYDARTVLLKLPYNDSVIAQLERVVQHIIVLDKVLSRHVEKTNQKRDAEVPSHLLRNVHLKHWHSTQTLCQSQDDSPYQIIGRMSNKRQVMQQLFDSHEVKTVCEGCIAQVKE